MQHSLRSIGTATLRRFSRALFASIKETIWPSYCVLCGPLSAIGDVEGVCDVCAARAVPLDSTTQCAVCAVTVERAALTKGRCGPCRLKRPPYRKLNAAFEFEGVVRRLIGGLKYGKDPAFSVPLAVWLERAERSIVAADSRLIVDLVCPMPSTPLRTAERGFNQAELIAERIAPIHGALWRPHAMSRIHDRDPQVGKSKAARRELSADEFDASGVFGRRVLLVDDVVTTGQTMRAASEALKRSGALEVRCLVAARAV